MKQQTLVYRDGVLVSSETQNLNRSRPHTDVLDKSDELLAHQSNTYHVMLELSQEVRALRRKLIRAERLARVRERERDSVKAAHQRLQTSIQALRSNNEDLQAELFAIKSDIEAGAFSQQEEAPTPLPVDSNAPRAFAASPRKRTELKL